MSKKKVSPSAGKPIFKRWWFWLIAIILVAGIAGSSGGKNDGKDTAQGEPTPTAPSKNVPSAEPTSSGIDAGPEETPELTPTPANSPEELEQTVEPDQQPTVPVVESPQAPVTQAPEPDPTTTQNPPRNTNADGKDRRSNWQSGYYLGSSESDKYHDYECRAAKNILPENEVWFSSEADAQAAGYSRCGICWR